MDSSRLVLVGTYTDTEVLAHIPKTEQCGEGVHLFEFTAEGRFRRALGTLPVANPAVLHQHPKRPRTLYAVAETIQQHGFIRSFAVGAAQERNKSDVPRWTPRPTLTCQGRSSCYLAVDPVDGRFAIAVNYWEGSLDVFDLESVDAASGSPVIVQHVQHCAAELERGDLRQVGDRVDHWTHRQVGPHAHSAHYFHDVVFVPDLGANAIFQYRFHRRAQVDRGEPVLTYQCRVPLKAGAGPRHMVFHPTLPVAYVSNELSGSVTVLALSAAAPQGQEDAPRLRVVEYQDTLPPSFRASSRANYVAELKLDAQGRFLYVSNRGDESIAVLKVSPATGQLTLSSIHPTLGACPRHFAISPDAEGRFLLAANQDTNAIVVFRRDWHTGALTPTGEQLAVPAPNYVLFHSMALGQLLAPPEARADKQAAAEVEKVAAPILWTRVAFASLALVSLLGALRLVARWA